MMIENIFSQMNLSPVLLFLYNRPEHTLLTIDALKRNELALSSKLIVFCDGPKPYEKNSKIREVRLLAQSIRGFKSITVVERNENLGLAKSIIYGVTKTIKDFHRVIVLEDDMITSPFFLRYMNDGLQKFQHEKRVGSIHAYSPQLIGLPEYFFIKGGDCWGWATWKDRWDIFQPDGKILLRTLMKTNLLEEFDRTGGANLVGMLLKQILDLNQSWYIRWHGSLFLAGLLTLQPGISFLQNIGLDGTGTNCANTNIQSDLDRSYYDGIHIDKVNADIPATQIIYKHMEQEVYKGSILFRLASDCINKYRMMRIL